MKIKSKSLRCILFEGWYIEIFTGEKLVSSRIYKSESQARDRYNKIKLSGV